MTSPVIAAAYFAAFFLTGVFLPYFPIYCGAIGLSAATTGLVLAVGPAMRVLSPPAWGYAADRFGMRGWLLVVSPVGSALVVLPLLWTPAPWAVLATAIAFAFFQAPFVPMLDAATWERLSEFGGDYGRIRLWGSLGFIGASLLGGVAIERSGPHAVIVLLVGSALVLAAVVGRGSRAPVPGKLAPPRSGQLGRPFILLLAVAFVMHLSHGAFYGFFSIHLQVLGYGGGAIGVAWAIGVAAEVLCLVRAHGAVRALGAERVMAICLLAATGRWALLAATTRYPLILVAQLVHALTFAAFHVACMVRLADLVPAGLRTTGQGFYSAISFGLATGIGMLAAGVGVDVVGTEPIFAASAAVAALGLVPTALLARAQRR